MEGDIKKYYGYKEQKIRLKKALNGGFYVEAIVIEYAMIEDRIKSILSSAGISLQSKGRNNTISKNCDLIISHKIFNESKMVRSKVPQSLVEEIKIWISNRNNVVHALLSTEFESGQIKEFAEEGAELLRQIDNKSGCVKRYFLKEKKENEKNN